MAELFDIARSEDAALASAERALSGGQLVVFPTDTVYGLGARPDVDLATERLFEAKRRRPELALPVLVAGVAAAATVAAFDDRARLLARRFWPGGLTLVLPRTHVSRAWELGGERDTVGVRVPNHPTALTLLAHTGPLAVTSANLSGEPTPPDCPGVHRALGDSVAVYLCAGRRADGPASTVVDLTEPQPRILRPGAISDDDIAGALRAG